MFTKVFWKRLIERAVRTFAWTFTALVGADSLNVLDADWPRLLGVSAGASLVALLGGLALQGVGPRKDSPSIVE